MSKWKPIAEYNKLKRPPKKCVFYFPATTNGRNRLSETVQTVRRYGTRLCTHYIEIGTPEEGELKNDG